MPSLQVEVLTPDQTLYQGSAVAVTATNDDGIFDIMPMHSSFITLIKDTLVIHLSEQEKKEFTQIHGVLRCMDEHVSIYLGV